MQSQHAHHQLHFQHFVITLHKSTLQKLQKAQSTSAMLELISKSLGLNSVQYSQWTIQVERL